MRHPLAMVLRFSISGSGWHLRVRRRVQRTAGRRPEGVLRTRSMRPGRRCGSRSRRPRSRGSCGDHLAAGGPAMPHSDVEVAATPAGESRERFEPEPAPGSVACVSRLQRLLAVQDRRRHRRGDGLGPAPASRLVAYVDKDTGLPADGREVKLSDGRAVVDVDQPSAGAGSRPNSCTVRTSWTKRSSCLDAEGSRG